MENKQRLRQIQDKKKKKKNVLSYFLLSKQKENPKKKKVHTYKADLASWFQLQGNDS
jgi:hypothetical protein